METQTIKQTVSKSIDYQKIILFGSRARGDHQEDSDWDILVLINEELTPREKLPYRTNIRKDLLKYNIFSDILIQSLSEFNKNKTLTSHICQTIDKEGVEI